MQTLVSFSVMLTSEGFSANGAHKGALISMSPKVRAQVICSGESFGAQCALECSGVFLNAGSICSARGGTVRVREFEDVVSVWDGRCGTPPGGFSSRRGITGERGGEGAIKGREGTISLVLMLMLMLLLDKGFVRIEVG